MAFGRVDDVGSIFVIDLDELERALAIDSDVAHRRNRVAVIERFLARHGIAGHVAAMVPALISGKSSRVTTALTPGNFAASDVSIDLNPGMGMGLRKILPISMRAGTGRRRSARAPSLVDAVMFDRRSADDLELPVGMKRSYPESMSCVPSHFLGGGLHGADDLVIAVAAAEMPASQ